jgi:hypothetical protein
MLGVAQKLTVANGGNIYAFHGDQQWSSYTDYLWQFTSSPDLVPVPVDPPPTTFTPPYTPSPDGTTISGGTGSLVTDDGVWTFGPPQSGGWVPLLNGVIAQARQHAVTQVQVNAHGQLFAKITDVGWATWEQGVFQTATAPTSLPIPVSMDFSPSFGTPPFSTPIGTRLTTISVGMSDGSPFTGTLTITGGASPIEVGISGSDIVTIRSPLTGGGQVFSVLATQTGCTSGGYFDINAS